MHLRCPHCQNPIELVNAPTSGEITCAGCGSSFQLDAPSTATFEGTLIRRLGKFELLNPLGNGAFGIVYKARDTELDRMVAVKIPRAGNIGSGPDDVDRFLREARAVAQLRFPSIISIHEVGIDNDTPYLVCDFVEGITLADHLTGRGFSFTESAKLLSEIANALQYAHSLGVVHRDIKPSNIMIRPDGSPCVMDFGLAKRDAGEITMTIDGQILGTPAYMSPEQARGDAHKVDGRSDVYSLGVILYQLLTNELPFRGNKTMLLHQVLHDEPRSLRTLNDRIPRDLETIALKAMAKEPARRYASAKEMADDLRRWLAGEPIMARPVGKVERAIRWCNRNQVVASLLFAIGLTLTLGICVATFFALEANDRATQLEKKTEEAKKAALDAITNAKKAEDAKVVADLAAEKARRNEKAAFFSLYAAQTNLLQRYWNEEQYITHDLLLRTVKKSVTLSPICGWEWDFQNSMHQGSHWDLGRGFFVRFSPKGDLLATYAVEDGIRIFNWEKRHQIHLLKEGIRTNVNTIAWHPDGNRLAVGIEDGSIVVYNARTGSQLAVWKEHRLPVLSLAFDPKGNWLISCGGDANKGEAFRWDFNQGKINHIFKGHDGILKAVAYDPTGRHIAYGGSYCHVWLVDAETLGLVDSFRWEHQNTHLAFSPDGSRLAAVQYGPFRVRIYDVDKRQELKSIGDFKAHITGIAYSPDNMYLATTNRGEGIRFWDARTNKLVHQWPGMGGFHDSISFHPDGFALATTDGSNAQIWSATTRLEERSLVEKSDVTTCLAFSAEDRFLCSGPPLKIWDTRLGRVVRPLKGLHAKEALSAAYGPNGTWIAGGTAKGFIAIWDAATGDEIRAWEGHKKAVSMIAVEPNRKRVATACDDGTTKMWDVQTGSELWTTGGGMQTDSLRSFRNKRGLAFSLNGKLLAVDGSDNSIILYDSANGQELFRLKGHENQIRCLAFSSCGEFLASGSGDHSVRLWSLKSRKEVWRVVSGHASRTRGIAFRADGKRLITGGGGWGNPSSVRLRLLGEDAEGQETFSLPFEFNDPIWCLAISNDGDWIAAGGTVPGTGSVVKLWDGRPLTPEVRIEREAVALVHWVESQGLATIGARERIRSLKSLYEPVRRKAIELLELY